jgi:hypothetical protein
VNNKSGVFATYLKNTYHWSRGSFAAFGLDPVLVDNMLTVWLGVHGKAADLPWPSFVAAGRRSTTWSVFIAFRWEGTPDGLQAHPRVHPVRSL